MEPLTPLAENLWVATRPLRLPVGDIGTRMTVIRLADGGLFLHSPIRLDDETRAALDAIGPVRCVVAPSKVHHFFVGAYRDAYPHAKLFAAPGLPAKRKDLRFDAVLASGAGGGVRARRFEAIIPGVAAKAAAVAPALNEAANDVAAQVAEWVKM